MQCKELLLPVNFGVFVLQETIKKTAKTKIQDIVGETDPRLFFIVYIQLGGAAMWLCVSDHNDIALNSIIIFIYFLS